MEIINFALIRNEGVGIGCEKIKFDFTHKEIQQILCCTSMRVISYAFELFALFVSTLLIIRRGAYSESPCSFYHMKFANTSKTSLFIKDCTEAYVM